MRMEVSYEVIEEKFNFSGYLHSFYSPHFSVNYRKTDDIFSIFFNVYPKEIKLKRIKLYMKLSHRLMPLTLNEKDLFPFNVNGILLRLEDKFALFSSTNNKQALVYFNFSNGYLLVDKIFDRKTICKGENKVLFIRKYIDSMKNVFDKHFQDLKPSFNKQRATSWKFFSLSTKYNKDDYLHSIKNLLHTSVKPNYLFLDPFLTFDIFNKNKFLQVRSLLNDNSPLLAISVSPFIVSKNSLIYHEFAHSKIQRKFATINNFKGFSVLNPEDEKLIDFIKQRIQLYLRSGVSLIRFYNLFPAIRVKALSNSIVRSLHEIITYILNSFPSTKIIVDLPYTYYPYKADFVELNDFLGSSGAIFKSWRIDGFKVAESVFLLLFNRGFSNFSFPIMGFALNFLGENDKYFLSLINYLFSDMLNFSLPISNYSREELLISKKMIAISPNIRNVNYEDDVFRITFETDEEFTAYINLSKKLFKHNSLKVKPMSIALFDKNHNIRKWPFHGW